MSPRRLQDTREAAELVQFIVKARDTSSLLRVALDLVAIARRERASGHTLFFIEAALRRALELAE
jgi:hypothetical protein